jgi:hypothetical protein
MTDLAERTGLNAQQLKKRLDWWSSKGFIYQGGLHEIMLEETYCLTPSAISIENISKEVYL